jgi:TRAP-type mannitol/chloroaromatic compound transport system permease small subunit
MQATLDILLYLVFFFPGIISLVIAGYYFAEMSWRFGERSMMTPGGPPIYHFKTVIPIAGFFTVLQGVAEVLRCMMALKTGVWPARFEDVQEAP